VSCTEKNSPITAILLAAGGSRRLGQPKQLVPFKNDALINYIIDQIRNGGIKDIKVVLGSHYKEIKSQIISREVDILENLEWEEGISSSIKCGLRNINLETQAVILFIVDQPYLNSLLICEILNKFRTSDAKIIAACVSGQFAHPVLFRKELFPKLLELSGDVGGKMIFKDEAVEKVLWTDERLLMDIDSIEDYEKIKGCVS